ncbi:ubiquinone biosynthesis monooxygenase coq6 mitochondrial [Holotrichia oblita]|uniref:Ubiquinone biosynthesis monooxygenase coq6 mitochondrial n=1 Tax=Holotrichia oblita TaxID=644536 RepID=A0ACB9TD53_HOLOL|nr:ubiquinone biosynthesis monooxygenase coq6 mitochondrial [Holotrichia oblita]
MLNAVLRKSFSKSACRRFASSTSLSSENHYDIIVAGGGMVGSTLACTLTIHEDEEIQVELENGASYTCELLLGCDGVNSKVREAMGVQYVGWNYKQMGLVATLNLSEDTEENRIAWQRYIPTGTIALLPLNTKQSSLVWCNTNENIKQLLKLSPEQFVDELNSALWKQYEKNDIVNQATKCLGSILKTLDAPANIMQQLPPSICSIEESSRAAFPLGFGHAANYIRKGVALVGDAAHRVHPLGGQGVNLGFGDICSLDEILGNAAYSGRKLNNLLDLRKYETARQRHNVPTMLALDGLQKLYTTDFTPVVLLRSLGLQLTHALTPVKRAIIEQASH